jgi:hypothetical protein
LSADGLTVAIGAYLNDGNGLGSGHIRVLEWDSSAGWTQKGDEKEMISMAKLLVISPNSQCRCLRVDSPWQLAHVMLTEMTKP